MVCEADSFYCLNAFPFLGRGSADPEDDQNHGHYYVKQLLTNLKRRGRTVCHDNWFSSLNLATDLLESGIHSVGTIQPKPYLLSKQVLKGVKLGVGESVGTFHHEKICKYVDH